MKKFIIITVLLLSITLMMTACSTEKIKNDPEINVKFIVSDLTDEEFKSVGTKELENAVKADFKNIEFTLDVEHSSKITNRKIIIPDIKKAANSYDKARYWFGESYSQDNYQERFANYGDKFVFYSKGLDEEAVKKIFSASEVKVSWTAASGDTEEKVFKLSEIIQFK